jgi:hypothetical protein
VSCVTCLGSSSASDASPRSCIVRSIAVRREEQHVPCRLRGGVRPAARVGGKGPGHLQPRGVHWITGPRSILGRRRELDLGGLPVVEERGAHCRRIGHRVLGTGHRPRSCFRCSSNGRTTPRCGMPVRNGCSATTCLRLPCSSRGGGTVGLPARGRVDGCLDGRDARRRSDGHGADAHRPHPCFRARCVRERVRRGVPRGGVTHGPTGMRDTRLPGRFRRGSHE